MAVGIFPTPEMPLIRDESSFQESDKYATRLMNLQKRVAAVEKRKREWLDNITACEATLKKAEESIAAHERHHGVLEQDLRTLAQQIAQKPSRIPPAYAALTSDENRLLERAQAVKFQYEASEERIRGLLDSLCRSVG